MDNNYSNIISPSDGVRRFLCKTSMLVVSFLSAVFCACGFRMTALEAQTLGSTLRSNMMYAAYIMFPLGLITAAIFARARKMGLAFSMISLLLAMAGSFLLMMNAVASLLREGRMLGISGSALELLTFAALFALITNLADVPLLLFYADCVPVLLADPETGTIGLAHAGWRGTAAQIVKKTVSAMTEAFGVRPENLLAAIGPSIGDCCYEVDDVVKNEMSEYESCFTAKCDGKYWLDLWHVNRQQLMEAGVTPSRISVAGVCTNHNPELFCSYRYENGRTGRMGVCLCRKG